MQILALICDGLISCRQLSKSEALIFAFPQPIQAAVVKNAKRPVDKLASLWIKVPNSVINVHSGILNDVFRVLLIEAELSLDIHSKPGV